MVFFLTGTITVAGATATTTSAGAEAAAPGPTGRPVARPAARPVVGHRGARLAATEDALTRMIGLTIGDLRLTMTRGRLEDLVSIKDHVKSVPIRKAYYEIMNEHIAYNVIKKTSKIE